MVFALLRKREKFSQLSIGLVEQALGKVLADVNKLARQAPHCAIDYVARRAEESPCSKAMRSISSIADMLFTANSLQ